MLLLRSLPRDRTKKRYNIKICLSPSLLAIQRVNYVASLANESKIARSLRSQVLARSRDRDTVLACLLVAMRSLARSSRCDTRCSLARSRYHVLVRSLARRDAIPRARSLAIPRACSLAHSLDRDTTKNVLLLFARRDTT